MELIIALALLGLLLFVYFRFFKIPKLKNIIFVDGSLGTGKTFTCVYFAIKLYKRALRAYKVKRVIYKVLRPLGRFKAFQRIIAKFEGLEEPILFSNMPLRRVKFSDLTLDIVLRNKRVPYKSVILIDDITTLADQFDFKDRDVSNSLRDFFQFWRHESHGGYIVMNTSTTSSLHYAIKAVLSDYIYLHHNTKLPFFCALKCQEMLYSADKDSNSLVNNTEGDIEDSLKTLLIPKSVFRKYDTYYLSSLTDGLEIEDSWYILDKSDSAKAKQVLTFKKGRYIIHEKVSPSQSEEH